jgi:hypothetical protein
MYLLFPKLDDLCLFYHIHRSGLIDVIVIGDSEAIIEPFLGYLFGEGGRFILFHLSQFVMVFFSANVPMYFYSRIVAYGPFTRSEVLRYAYSATVC